MALGDMTARLVIDVMAQEAQQQLNAFNAAAERSFAGVEANLRVAEERAKQFSERWRSSFDAARKAGLALTAVGGAIAIALQKAVGAASEQEAAFDKLSKIYKGNAQAIADYAAEVQKQTRFGDELIINAAAVASTYVNLRGSIEQAIDAAVNMSEVSGQDLVQAMHLLGRASSGQIGALTRVGIQVNKAAFEAEGMTAVFRQIAEENQNVAFTSEGMGKRVAQVRNAMGDLAETIGFALQDSLNATVPILQDMVSWLKAMVETPAGKAVVQITAGFGGLALAVGPLLIALPTIVTQLQALPSAASAAFAAMASGPGVVVAAIGIATVAVLGLIGALDRAAQKSREQAAAARLAAADLGQDELRDHIDALEKEIETRQKVIETLREQYSEGSNLAQGLTFGLVRPQESLRRALDASGEALLDLNADLVVARARLSEMGAEAAVAASNAAGGVDELTQEERDAIDEANRLAETFTRSMRDISESVEDAAGRVQNANKGITDAWKNAARSLEDADEAIATAREDLAKAVEDASESIQDAMDRQAEVAEQAQQRVDDATERSLQVAEDAATRRQELADAVADAETRRADAIEDAERRAEDAVKTAQERAAERVKRAQERVQGLQERRMLEGMSPEQRKAYEEAKAQRELIDAIAAVDDERRKGAQAVQEEYAKQQERLSDIEAQENKRVDDAIARQEKELDAIRRREEAATEAISKALEAQTKANEDAQKAVTKAREAAAEQIEAAIKRVQDAEEAYQDAVENATAQIEAAYERRKEAVKSYERLVRDSNERIADSYRDLADAQQKAGIDVTAQPGQIQARQFPAPGPGGITINVNGNIYGDEHLRRTVREEIAGAVRSASYVR